MSPGLLVLILALGFPSAAGNRRRHDFRPIGWRKPGLCGTGATRKRKITLRDAALLTLQRNPELASFAKEMRALEGATLQAGLLPNPELSVNVENIGNIQPLTGDINSQKSVAQEVVQQITTIRLYQLIELGGKRAARVNAASLE